MKMSKVIFYLKIGQVRGNNSVPKEESKNDAGTYTEEVSSSIMLSITSKLK